MSDNINYMMPGGGNLPKYEAPRNNNNRNVNATGSPTPQGAPATTSAGAAPLHSGGKNVGARPFVPGGGPPGSNSFAQPFVPAQVAQMFAQTGQPMPGTNPATQPRQVGGQPATIPHGVTPAVPPSVHGATQMHTAANNTSQVRPGPGANVGPTTTAYGATVYGGNAATGRGGPSFAMGTTGVGVQSAKPVPANPNAKSSADPKQELPSRLHTQQPNPRVEESCLVHVFAEDDRLEYTSYPPPEAVAHYKTMCHASKLPAHAVVDGSKTKADVETWYPLFLGQLPNVLPPEWILWALDMLAGQLTVVWFVQAKRTGYAKAWVRHEQCHKRLMERARCLMFDLNGIWTVKPLVRRGKNLGKTMNDDSFWGNVNDEDCSAEGLKIKRQALGEDRWLNPEISRHKEYTKLVTAPFKPGPPTGPLALDPLLEVEPPTAAGGKTETEEEMMAKIKSKLKKTKSKNAPPEPYGSEKHFVFTVSDRQRRLDWEANDNYESPVNPQLHDADATKVKEPYVGEQVMALALYKVSKKLTEYLLSLGHQSTEAVFTQVACPDPRLPHGPIVVEDMKE